MHNSDLRSPRPMPRSGHWLRFSIAQLVTASLVTLAFPASALTYDSTYRSTSRDYQACVAGITGTGIADPEAARACAAALDPRDLSRCVVNIESQTALTAEDALSNCRRVRRPVEMASCVVDISAIDNPTDAQPLTAIVDHCRRSLLPLRFSACVTGLRSQIDYSTDTALSDCIAATNRPRLVLPNFLPRRPGTILVDPSTLPLQPTEPLQSSPLQTTPPQTNPQTAPQESIPFDATP